MASGEIQLAELTIFRYMVQLHFCQKIYYPSSLVFFFKSFPIETLPPIKHQFPVLTFQKPLATSFHPTILQWNLILTNTSENRIVIVLQK